MNSKFYHTKESVDAYIKMAEGVSGSQLIKKLKLYLPQNSTLLEIGSGPGTDWEILNKFYQVVGSDFSNEFLSRLIDKYPQGTFLKLDAITLSTDQHFDCIYSNKVLHHLTDEELHASIKRQYEILIEGGIVCHSFWKGEGTENYEGMFVNNHRNKEVEEFFGNYFECLLLEDYQEFEAGDSILFIGKKK